MIEKIIRIAQGSGKILMKYHGKNPDSKLKADKTLVTIADTESDSYILSELRKEFPKDKILSEETENSINNYSGNVWIVDPLDGTSTFSDGNNGFCNIIGLCRDGVPVLGVIYAPALGQLFYAEKDKGAYMRDSSGTHKLKVSDIADIMKATAILKPGKTRISEMPVKNMPYTEYSAAMKIMEIAQGRIDFHVDTVYLASKWDVCGTQIILEEAGGKLSDVLGNPIDYMSASSHLENSFTASNERLHEKVIAETKKYI
jgi:3'(2'), 5'-bisphosphate nucleotidase